MFDIEVSPEVIQGFQQIGVCNVVDVLDHQLHMQQWMDPAIKPIFKSRIAGQAITLLEVPAAGAKPSDMAQFLDAVELCGPGSIFTAAMPGNRTYSIMGDLVALALHERGCAGAVLDGAVRDIDNMIKIGFPVFSAAVSPVDKTEKIRTVGYNLPISCGGVLVNPGDVIVADWDGIVVVPAAIAEDVYQRALKLNRMEDEIMTAIKTQIKDFKMRDIIAKLKK